MSIQAVSWVLGDRGKGWAPHPARGADRLVLIVLANHANAEWECYPSLAAIAWESGLSERRVHDAIRRLETAGWLVRAINAAPDSRIRADRRPNLYRIVTDGMDGMSTPSSERGGHSRSDGVDKSVSTGWTERPPKPSIEPSESQQAAIAAEVEARMRQREQAGERFTDRDKIRHLIAADVCREMLARLKAAHVGAEAFGESRRGLAGVDEAEIRAHFDDDELAEVAVAAWQAS